MYGLSFYAIIFDLGPRSKVKYVVLWICHILGPPTCLIFNIMKSLAVTSYKQASKQTNKQTNKHNISEKNGHRNPGLKAGRSPACVLRF